MGRSLIDGLLSEISRVKEIVKEYESPELKGTGYMAAFLMKQDISDAETALATIDIGAMVRCFTELKDYNF